MGEDSDFDDDREMRRRLPGSLPSAVVAAPYLQNWRFCANPGENDPPSTIARNRRGGLFPTACPSRHCAWPIRSAGLLTISSSSSGHEEHVRIAARPATGRPLFPAAPLLNPAATRAGQRVGSVTAAVGEAHGLSPLTRRLRSLSRSISLTRQVRRGRLPVGPPGGQGVCWSAR